MNEFEEMTTKELGDLLDTLAREINDIRHQVNMSLISPSPKQGDVWREKAEHAARCRELDIDTIKRILASRKDTRDILRLTAFRDAAEGYLDEGDLVAIYEIAGVIVSEYSEAP